MFLHFVLECEVLIVIFTEVHKWTQLSTVQSTTSHPSFVTFIVILFSNLHPALLNGIWRFSYRNFLCVYHFQHDIFIYVVQWYYRVGWWDLYAVKWIFFFVLLGTWEWVLRTLMWLAKCGAVEAVCCLCQLWRCGRPLKSWWWWWWWWWWCASRS